MALNICLHLEDILNTYSLMGIDTTQTQRIEKVYRENKKVNFWGTEKKFIEEVESIFTGLGIKERTWQRGGSEKFGARLAIAAGLATIVASAFLQ